jgi:cyclopropane-fatty-acyl-phospholipid synthase
MPSSGLRAISVEQTLGVVNVLHAGSSGGSVPLSPQHCSACSRAGLQPAPTTNRAIELLELRDSPIALRTEAANLQHYELPAGLFEHVLGRQLKYSCAYYPRGDETLDQAEEAMLSLCAERAELADGQDILELGCGWGSLTLWMAARYPTARITAVSNSASQRVYIEKRCKERGFATSG